MHNVVSYYSFDNNMSLCQKEGNCEKSFFTCKHPGCDKKFRTKFSMKRHAYVHTQDKKYACKYCDKRFSLPQYLKEHTFTHTQDKPYVCGVAGCEKRFRQAGKLSLHRRTHDEYVLKQYNCQNAAINSVAVPLANIEEPHQIKNETAKDLPVFFQKESDECQCVVQSANGRPLFRQDSGQTNATVQAKEDMAELKDVVLEPMQVPGQENARKGLSLTREALEMHNRIVETEDALLHYLSHIDSPRFRGLRPVLPYPKGNLFPKPMQQRTPPDLFELMRRYTKE